MKKYKYSNLKLEVLFKHFYNSHETILIYDKNELRGAITYSSFIEANKINEMIRKVIFVKSEKDIETGDLVNVYCIKNGNKILEVSSKADKRCDFNIERFKELYAENDIIINYLKNEKIDNVFVIGKQREYISNFINMYGSNMIVMPIEDSDIEILFTNKIPNLTIIDTSNNTDLYKKINYIKKTDYTIYSLKELAKYSEIYNYINLCSQNKNINSYIFRYPDIKELTNLTVEEKGRIEFDHYYKYYYDKYLNEGLYEVLLRKVLKDSFSRDFIESRYSMPKVYLKGGVYYLEDSNNLYCQSINGHRITTNQDKDYVSNINVFGPCIVFGALSDDYNTLTSYMQRIINEANQNYRVNNYGARAIDFSENLRTSRDINLYKNDINIYIVNSEEANILKKMGYIDIHSLVSVFNDSGLHDYFIDEPVHCNQDVNKLSAHYIYDTIKNDLKKNISKEDCELVNTPLRKNIFENNIFLQEYLDFLNKYTNYHGKTGCIVMNCNPFTYGHYNLIDYARKKVDRLIVFVVQEDKSYFKFDDRFNMVIEGCKDFENVVVIPSGKLLASAMLFPSYFDKEESENVYVDVSMDIEVFTQHIAPYLDIKLRFVGEENYDRVTSIYNRELKRILPLHGIEIVEIPRFRDSKNREISAKVVRKNFEQDRWKELESQVPNSTMKVLKLKKGKGE